MAEKSMEIPHFMNELRCNNSYGASCALDVFLESYYYGLYLQNTELHNPSSSGRFIELLNDICKKRLRHEKPNCVMREDIWNWCVTNLPKAFADKGTHEAETIEAFRTLGSEDDGIPVKFKVFFEGSRVCSEGHHTLIRSALENIILVPWGANARANGYIPSIFTERIWEKYRINIQNKECPECDEKCTDICEVRIPPFLLFQIGVNDKLQNVQEPPVQIAEECSFQGVPFQLTAAVQHVRGHFTTIVFNLGQYHVIDDTKESSSAYAMRVLHVLLT
jgi:hypothetical protein